MLRTRRILKLPAHKNHIDEFAGAILDAAFDNGMAFLWQIDGALRIFNQAPVSSRLNGRPLSRLGALGRAEFLGQYNCYANGNEIIDDINFIIQNTGKNFYVTK